MVRIVNNKLVVLVDYRGSFYSTVSSARTLCTMNVSSIVGYFTSAGFDVQVLKFTDVDFSKNWQGVPVLYTSSEDIGLLYKGFIEDVVLGLDAAGALLLPNYRYLRSHHNKLMMELLRYQLFPEEAKRLQTSFFGTFEELKSAENSRKWPKVLKAAYGAGSKQVVMAKGREELLSLAKKISRSWSFGDVLRELRSRLIWRGYAPRSLNRTKFIVQNLVENLDGDFKVLRFGKRFYVLSRKNRKNDFRASGSGNFSREIPSSVNLTELLNYSKWASDIIGSPVCSLDVAFDGNDFHLIEFQCLNFGTLTAEFSDYCHVFSEGTWSKALGKCDLELVFCDSVMLYLSER